MGCAATGSAPVGGNSAGIESASVDGMIKISIHAYHQPDDDQPGMQFLPKPAGVGDMLHLPHVWRPNANGTEAHDGTEQRNSAIALAHLRPRQVWANWRFRALPTPVLTDFAANTLGHWHPARRCG
jgi:hypothetical protein